MMYTREDKVAHLRNSNADWVPKLKIPKPFLPQTEDTPPISQEPAPAPVSGAHGLKGGFMGDDAKMFTSEIHDPCARTTGA